MGLGRRAACLITAMLIMSWFFTAAVFAAATGPLPDSAPELQTGIANPIDNDLAEVLSGTETEDPGAATEQTTPPGITSTSTTDSSIILTPATDSDGSTDSETEPSAVSTPAAIQAPIQEDDESLWYSPKIPMKKEYQKLLWDYSKKRNLNYIDMLALISLESNFYEKSSNGRYKGYFQISTAHGPNLSKTLKTLNKPLDGAISINWGTAMYSWILADKRVKGLEGKKQRDVALSIFQRGAGGYDKRGINNSYLKKYYKKRDIIVSYFEK